QTMAYLEKEVIVVAGDNCFCSFHGILAKFDQFTHRLSWDECAERLVRTAAFCRTRLHKRETVSICCNHRETFGPHQQERTVQREARFLKRNRERCTPDHRAESLDRNLRDRLRHLR